MVRPTGVRTVAGFTLGERLGHDIYGEVHRAREGKREVRLLLVEPGLAGDGAFDDALAHGKSPLLGAFQHRSVVGTVVVARDGKQLVVVTEQVDGATPLAEVLARARARGGKVPTRVAASIGRAVIDALAAAHVAGIVHGAVHPRSVLIGPDGVVRLTDFAVGFAAMSAAAAGSEAMPLKGLAGYLAPEIALGDGPSPAADVFAVGALMFTMLTGDVPPGSLNTSPAVERLVQRALDTDLARRFGDAIELQENYIEALEDDRWEVAPPAELARWLGEQGVAAPEPNLDDATEDLLASLEGSVDVQRPPSAPAAAPRLESVLSDLEEHTDASLDGPHTVVEDGHGQAARDPISELLALDAENLPTNIVDPDGARPLDDDGGHTPLPPPQPDEPGTVTREASSDAIRPIKRPEPTPKPSRLVEATRPKAPARAASSVEPEVDVVPDAPAPAPAPRKVARPADEVEAVEPPRLKGTPWWAYVGLVAVLVGGAALFWKIRQNADKVGEGQAAADAKKAAKEKEAAELQRRLIAEQADPGSIVVRSTPDEAAVYLLLGRTPFDSHAFPTDMVWNLRVELEGYQSQYRFVGGKAWSGGKDDRKAELELTLTPGAGTRPLPAFPPAPAPEDEQGLAEGSGVLHVTSKPSGAAVYLLVGVTNKMQLSDIEAGRDYELKVIKDGFLPGFVRIAAEEWRYGGDPRLPLSAAPKRPTIERSVELVAQPPGK